MRSLVVLVVAVVLAVAALNLITTEVPSINPHEGAVAYAQPKVSQSFSQTGQVSNFFGVGIPSAPTLPIPTVEVNPIKYSVPAPTHKSLWQQLFPPATFTQQPPGDTTVGGGDTCTLTSTTKTDLTFTTHVKGTVVGPTSAQVTFESPAVTTTVHKVVQSYSCTSGTPKQVWSFTGTADYDIGTYYFTNGWGSYGFTVEVWGGLEGDAPAKLSSTQLAVSASAAGSS